MQSFKFAEVSGRSSNKALLIGAQQKGQKR